MAVDLTRTNLKSLGARMFYGCSAITSIDCSGTNITTIPNSTGTSYNSYGDGGFTQSCSSLESINFSNCKNLTTVGTGAFGISNLTANRPNLKTINFSGCTKLNTLNNYAFGGTIGAVTVDFTDCPIEYINEGVFNNCKALNWILPLSKVKQLKAEAFNAAGDDNVVPMDFNLPLLEQWGHDTTGGGMFYHSPLIKSFSINGVSSFNDSKWNFIPPRMFAGCTNLQSVDLGTVPFKFIGGSAFKDTTALKTLTFNTSKVEYIGSFPWGSGAANQWNENCYHAFLNAGATDCTPIDITIDDGMLKWIYNYSFGNSSATGCRIVKSITCHNCTDLSLMNNAITYSTSLRTIDFSGSGLESVDGKIGNLPNIETLLYT